MLRRIGRAFLLAGSFLHAATQAQTRWELEVSSTILRRRWRLLLVALLPVLFGVGVELAFAALPETIGGSKAYMPIFVTRKMFYGSILVGLIAGLITGVIGAGGGYILTPALMSFGVKGIMAVGTDQFHLFAKAIMGTVIHRKLGNVNVWLAVWFVVGSFCGVSLGGMINRAAYQTSPALSDALISAVYVLILGTLGAYALADWLRLRKGEVAAKSSVEATSHFAKWLQSIRLVPRVKFDEDIVPGGRSISVYPVIITGFIVGFIAAIMGAGGGFLTFPMFVYGLGVSTFTTVGTDVLQIIFTTAYSSIFQYAVYGFIFYTVAICMLLGSLLGVQVGALVTTVVRGTAIRGFYAMTILAGFVNRACALPKKLANAGYITLAEATGKSIDLVGAIVFWILIGTFAVWILLVFFQNVGRFRAGEVTASSGGHQSGR
ncbi:MAG: sulfite exporter TauE/SafE family protein [Clostridia bacterium]